MEHTLLIFTDGYSINVTEYKTAEAARKAMNEQYANRHPDDNDEDFESASYINNFGATLYANGEDVFVWKIY